MPPQAKSAESFLLRFSPPAMSVHFELVAELLRSMPLGILALTAAIIWGAKEDSCPIWGRCCPTIHRQLTWNLTNNLTRSAHCENRSTAKPITCSQPDTYAGAARRHSRRMGSPSAMTAKVQRRCLPQRQVWTKVTKQLGTSVPLRYS